ncbi:MAG: DUF3108 domain-containing protein [Enterobacterales bacterium]|nr:DUF3108 domain-containing protein [Enterobacterales bacterium]
MLIKLNPLPNLIKLPIARFLANRAINYSCFRRCLATSLFVVSSFLCCTSIVNAAEERKNFIVKPLSDKPWVFLKNYQAKYKVVSKRKTLGHASRTLSQSNQHWTLSSYAKVSKLFFTLRSNESSQFHIESENLFPDRFYSRSKLTFKKARIMEQKFNWETMTETGTRNKKSWQLKHKKQVFDRISHVIQLRADLLTGKQVYSYPVSAKGKIVQYTYLIEQQETIKTKIGTLQALKLVRHKSNGDRFILWLCPDMNYFPIKIAQYEKGKPDITLIMESFEYLAEEKQTKEQQLSSKR